jgi:CPA2 family monovalent cation:H+ antiporter-2
VAIGPFTPGILGDPGAISQLAEIGIVFLMFVIGVQLSLRELVRASRIAVVGGLVQVLAMIGIGYAVGRALGWSPMQSYAFGAVISNSSSTVLGKVLSDRGEIDTRHARLALAWSSVQDISSVAIVAILALSSPKSGGAGPLLGKAAVFFVVVMPLAFWLLPRLLRRASAFRSREFFALAVVTLALAMAGGASLLGVSLALGAFLTGVVVGESDLSHRILGDAAPIRDVFSGIFFVSIGMLIDPSSIVDSWALVLLTVAMIVVVKGTVTTIVARILGCSAGLAVLVGAGLAQSAEFSFLLARIGLEEGALSQPVFNVLLSATVISVLLAPFVDAGVPALVRAWWPGAAPGAGDAATGTAAPGPSGHAVVCGYGRVGRIVCALLERHGQPFVVIEEDLRIVDDLRVRGVTAILGDASMPSVLDRAGIASARLLVLCMPDRMAARRALDHARGAGGAVDVLARSHSDDDRRILEAMGAGRAVVGELELALALGRCALERFRVEGGEIDRSVDALRQADLPAPGSGAHAGPAQR